MSIDNHDDCAHPLISVVIVNWNACDELEKCLRTIRGALKSIPSETIVVDNSSSDNSMIMLRSRHPEVGIIENKENLGFAKACNQGIAKSQGRFVLILNPDVVVDDETTIDRWLDYMRANRDVALTGCRLVSEDGRQQIGDAGYRPTLWSLISHFLFLARVAPYSMHPLYLGPRRCPQPFDVDWVCGAAMMVRREALREFGPLDESRFMYGEDVEFGCRIRSHGGRVIHLPHLRVVHFGGSSVLKNKDRRLDTMWLESVRSLFQRYNPRVPILAHDLIVASGCTLRLAAYWLITNILRLPGFQRKQYAMAGCLRYLLANFGARQPHRELAGKS